MNLFDGSSAAWDGGVGCAKVLGSGTATLVIAPDLGSGQILREPVAIRYRCVVTNSCGSATTIAVRLLLCNEDLSCDGFVDDSDFVGFAAAYELFLCDDSAMPLGCPADFSGDDVVEDSDFVLFAVADELFLCP
ncbi:MAG: hypothetical protein ACK58T_32435 [Phycisphaerae bacterium]